MFRASIVCVSAVAMLACAPTKSEFTKPSTSADQVVVVNEITWDALTIHIKAGRVKEITALTEGIDVLIQGAGRVFCKAPALNLQDYIRQYAPNAATLKYDSHIP